ncbi:MAG: hypothetical protein ACMZ7B_06585 [Balneola sp.]
MGKLTEEDIRRIIKRASVFQKFEAQAPANVQPFLDDDFETLYELADNLNIDRRHINSAIQESVGFEIEEPVSLDTGSSSEFKISGRSNGALDGASLNEIRAHLEYHFNTVGKISRRGKRVFWKANPSGFSRLFSITNSPEVQLYQNGNQVEIELNQNLSTLNKLLIPPFLAVIGAIFMLTAVVYGQVDGDGNVPMTIISLLFFGLGFIANRFVRRRKQKRKNALKDLVATIQQTIERNFLASKTPSKEKRRIKIPDLDDIEVEDEVTLGEKAKS